MPSYNEEYIEKGQINLTEEDSQLLAPYWNIVDTMKQKETLYDKLHKEGGNPYAAMPSMHTGWALWSCLTWIATVDCDMNSWNEKVQKCLAIAHPVCMVLVIIVTGNHFWLDAVAGATCAMIGKALAHILVQSLVSMRDNKSSRMARLLRRFGSRLVGPGTRKNHDNRELFQYDEEGLTEMLTIGGSLL